MAQLSACPALRIAELALLSGMLSPTAGTLLFWQETFLVLVVSAKSFHLLVWLHLS